MSKVFIVGASGLVGTAAANSFINAGWEVVATSRRAPQFIEGNYQHLPLDLTDTQACANALSTIKDISHVVYSAVFELPGLVAGWSDPLQIETNTQMIKNLVQPLLSDGQLQHFTLLQGTKAYGGSVQPMRVPAREDQERVEHPNFYWPQEDFTQESAAQHGFNYTILRPQLIVGPNYGVVMNLPPIIGAYAALCTH